MRRDRAARKLRCISLLINPDFPADRMTAHGLVPDDLSAHILRRTVFAWKLSLIIHGSVRN